MYYWRITKYDPQNRDENGLYKKDEWISIGGIGKKFEGVELTYEEYIRYENAYVDAVIRVMRENNVESLRIKPLQKNSYVTYDDFPEPETKNFYKSLKTNTMIPMNDIAKVVRFALRKEIWCKLASDKMFVHFGYDYYMFIGSENRSDEMINAIINNGLFVENFISPYLPDAIYNKLIKKLKLVRGDKT